jgi:hypothetical protein
VCKHSRQGALSQWNFQRGFVPSGLAIGLTSQVVPDASAIIGISREEAETLQANHMDMCRFSGRDDPNYRKVASELRDMYEHVLYITRLSELGTFKSSSHARRQPAKHCSKSRGTSSHASAESEDFLGRTFHG